MPQKSGMPHMRIILDNGAYTMRNMGDVAMLQVAARRIRRLHPNAEILVLTDRPDLLHRSCPGTLAISAAARDAALSPSGRGILSQLDHAQEPGLPTISARGFEPASPGLIPRCRTAWQSLRGRNTRAPADPREFARAFARSDMLVIAGGGFLNDLNNRAASTVLRMASLGLANGQRVVLLSQGLGPVKDPALLGQLSQVCGAGAFISLREPIRGPAAVSAAGAWQGRWAVTGDDALELACEAQASRGPGAAIGFSIRQIAYSGIGPGELRHVAKGLGIAREHTRAEILPLPISFNSFENDPGAITAILGRNAANRCAETPLSVIETAARCRVVVAGAYHAAVFALAQGVPCVCFHASRYYRDKMEGLAAQFGEGCAVVDLSRPNAGEEIGERALDLWQVSEKLRSALRNRAAEQARSAREFCAIALDCPERVAAMVF